MEFDGDFGAGQEATTFSQPNQGFEFDQAAQGQGDEFFTGASDTPFGAEPVAYAAPVPVDHFGGAAAAAVPVSAPVLMASPAAPAAEAANPLVEFNKKFRAICEEKDAKERDAKAARKAAGKAALKKLLAERCALVESRKASNREEEEAKQKEAMDALEGESWGRVVSLIDLHGAAAKAAAASSEEDKAGGGGGKKKAAAGGAVVPDVQRHKEILISLKAAGGLPPAQA